MNPLQQMEEFVKAAGLVKRSYASRLTEKEYHVYSRKKSKQVVYKFSRHSCVFDEESGGYIGLEYPQELTMTLTEKDSSIPREERRSVKVRVEFSGNDWLYICPEGYGEPGAHRKKGCPVFLELYDGKLSLIVHEDILEEEPKIISLEGAREDRLPETE